ncbi:MAG: M24 family metallopeptidase, partial [Nitrososphaeria archaeon]|nr:M24 family metallopeptidase [Nitrososphaeria archaeon]
MKSRQELVLMKKSAEITARSLGKAQDIIRPGISEHDLGAEIEYYAKRLGAEGRAFPTLITSAERSSLPHGEPSH